MSSIPFSNHTIKEVSELYGRDALLKKLFNEVDRYHFNVNIVGCRRFGKTCVLEVLYNIIRNTPDAKSYPVYIDAKCWNIGLDSTGKIGTANVYKYLLAILLESLTKDGHISEEVMVRDVVIAPVSDRHSFYKSLDCGCDSSIADTFSDAVLFFSKRIGKTIAFIFDEYEYLMSKAFGESTGFQTLRKLSSEDIDGFRPCSFLVAGAVTWEHLCSTIGSKELNTIGSHVHFVRPLKKEHFDQYWNDECKKIEDEALRSLMMQRCDFVFGLSGGVVFHANDIGASMLINDGVYPEDYSAALEEIMESLNYRQKETLFDVAIAPDKVQKGKELIYLRSIGLVSPDSVQIPIKLLNDWIQEESRYTQDARGTFLDRSTDEITDLIEAINDTVYNKGYIFMFTPQYQDAALVRRIKRKCVNKEGFGSFVDALWKTHFEKTKDEETQKTKAFLPQEYRRTQFTDIIGTLRHTYSGHLYGPKFVMPEGRLSKEDALFALVGSRNEPFGESDFLTLQKAVLDMYKVELKGILCEVKTWERASD